MTRLSRLALRSLSARPLRSVLTTAGIALGVGVLFAALLTNAAVDNSVDSTVSTLFGATDLRVGAFLESGLDATSQQAIATTPGVAVAAPQIERRAYVQGDPAAGTVAPAQPPVTVLGVDPVLDPQVHPAGVAQGAPLRTGDRTALVSQALADAGYSVGATISVLGSAAPDRATFTVSGVLPDGATQPGADRLVEIPIQDAAAIFGATGVTRVDVMTTPDTTATALADRLAGRLRSQPYVLSTPADAAAALRTSTASFQATTALIAAISLFVGAFLIFNTLSMTVAERVREVALLRAAGATRDQVHWYVLLQAICLGLLGSLAGLAVGWVLATWLIGTLAGASSSALMPLGVAVEPSSVVIAIGVGLIVSNAAAIEPAWRAGAIPPVEALRQRADLGRLVAARLRWLVLVFVVVGAVGLVLWPHAGGGTGISGFALVYALLLGATLLSPVLLPTLGRVAGAPFAKLMRAEERLARGTLSRDRSRTALTVGSLTVGLALIVALAAVGQNDRHAANAWLANVVPGDELLTAVRPMSGFESIEGTFRDLAGVTRVTPIARFDLASAGVRVDGAALSGADLLADGRLTFVAGDRTAALSAFDAGGTVLVPRSQADRLGVHLGDPLPLTAADGSTRTMRVAGILEHGLPGRSGEAILVAWSDATAQFGVVGADAFAVRLEPGSTDRTQLLVEQTAAELSLQPASVAAIAGAAGATLDRVFALFDALAAMAVVIAGLGIVNTLTMNVIERVREIGVLRAVGMTRRQVWRMVVVEAGIVGVAGVVLGAVTGLLVAVVMVGVSGGLAAILALQVPWIIVALAAVYGVAVAMLASMYPARLASRMSIVRAVSFE